MQTGVGRLSRSPWVDPGTAGDTAPRPRPASPTLYLWGQELYAEPVEY